ncbi:hypothetical protein ACKKBG_A02125 [Auxenochlorella protothecoides x Auxenochlorella symbiontica]
MIGSMFMNPYSYSLGARCGAEIIGTMIALFLGDAAVANELLAKTKGNGYGWGFLSMGFGFAFGFATMMFDHVSAYLNPAACLFQWVVGNINGTEFLALAFSELAGAFLGAILLWLCYLPHFNVVPEPPSVTEQDPFFADPLLGAGANRTFSPTDLAVGGYNNDPLDRHMRMNPGQAIQGTMRDIGAVLGIVHDDIKQRKEELLKVRWRTCVLWGEQGGVKPLGGTPAPCSVVAGQTLLLSHLQIQNAPPRSPPPHPWPLSSPSKTPPPAPQSLGRASVVNKDDIRRKIEVLDERSRTLTEHEVRARRAQDTLDTVIRGGEQGIRKSGDGFGGPVSRPSTADEEGLDGVQLPKTPAEVRYEALLVADQNIKLGIFCTRPAIYAPHWNFLCEFMSTVTLLVMANMIAARGSLLYEPARGLFGALFGFILGFFIFLIVLVIGGPTGVAINPARDLGPRIAHWMLPIPGKGPSEFLTYGWIPVIAPLCGGAAAGGLFILIQKFTGETNVPPGSVVCPNV